MKRIDRIIKEEINRFLVKEAYEDSDEYFISDDYVESNADNFCGEDGNHYYYEDGTPFAWVNGNFYVGQFGSMHSDCAAQAAFDGVAESSEQELDEVRAEIEDYEETIEKYSNEGVDTEDEEYELADLREREEYLENIVENYDYMDYWNECLDDNEKENWIQSLEECGRFWDSYDDTSAGVIACWSTPSVSWLQDIIQNLNQWSAREGKGYDFNNFLIAVGGTGASWGIAGHKAKEAKLIPVSKYAEEVKKANDEYRKSNSGEGNNGNNNGNGSLSVKDMIDVDRVVHNLPPSEKWRATANFRDTVNHKNGKKLTMSNGREMPMAQYHNMIYQESKNNKIDSLINEISSKFIQDRIANTFNNNKNGYNEYLEDVPKDTRVRNMRHIASDKKYEENPYSFKNHTDVNDIDYAKDKYSSSDIHFNDSEYQSINDLIDGVKSGELLIHARRMQGNEKGNWVYPEVGDTVKSCYGCEYGENDIEPLIFASDDLTWCEGNSELSKDRDMICFVESDNFIRNLGDCWVQEPNGAIYRDGDIPCTVEEGDWFSTEKAYIVAYIVKK